MNGQFQIGSDRVQIEDVMAEIRRRVEEKRARGVYRCYAEAGYEPDTAALKRSNDHFDYYLETIFLAAEIDISDFEIESKTRLVGWATVCLKKLIWKLLKFYTFRLFSQQRDFNTRTALILQGMEHRYSHQLAELEARIKDLDAGND